jgi:hypothetical protein
VTGGVVAHARHDRHVEGDRGDAVDPYHGRWHSGFHYDDIVESVESD